MLHPRNHRQLLASHRTKAWLRNFAVNHGEKMPNSSKICLSSLLTKREVYMMCKTELESINEEALSESYFYTVWKQEFPDVIIPKVGSTCSKTESNIIYFSLLYIFSSL